MKKQKVKSKEVSETVDNVINNVIEKELLEIAKTEESGGKFLKSLTLSIWDNSKRMVILNTIIQGVDAYQLRQDAVSVGLLALLHINMGVGNWFDDMIQIDNDFKISNKFIMANQAFNPNNEDDLIQYYTVYGQHMFDKILENKLNIFIDNCLVEIDKVLLRRVIDAEMEYQVAYKISVNKVIQFRKKLDKFVKFISNMFTIKIK